MIIEYSDEVYLYYVMKMILKNFLEHIQLYI